jgi:hypothetical protein
LGKTKKLLRARITEELKDERFCLWRKVLSEAKLMEAGPLVVVGGIRIVDEIYQKGYAALYQEGRRHSHHLGTDIEFG